MKCELPLSFSRCILPYPSQNGQSWNIPLLWLLKFCRLNSPSISHGVIYFVYSLSGWWLGFSIVLALKSTLGRPRTHGSGGMREAMLSIQLRTHFYVVFFVCDWMMATQFRFHNVSRENHYKFLRSLFLSLTIKLCSYAFICAWVCALGAGDYRGQERGFPRVGILGSCEPSNTGSGNWTQALWQNSHHC